MEVWRPHQPHINALAVLPDRGHQILRQIGPGWKQNKSHHPDEQWPPVFWFLHNSYDHLPASYWLPCDPMAIVEAAERIWRQAHPITGGDGEYYDITWRRYAASKRWQVCLVGPVEIQSRLGWDQHTAALLLLNQVLDEVPGA
jgi:hypothetical protein